ncbi:hypothetical protein DB346_09210 [Verrucomicrobia bacterium LW23]|nr:hypothetical protein DB346_09210 [Verrucomicrobia bacterium LW23]
MHKCLYPMLALRARYGRGSLRSRGGFTLLEVIVVLVVVMVISGLAIPLGYSFLRHEPLLREVRALEGAARVARQQAMSSQRAVTITFTERGWRTEWALDLNRNGKGGAGSPMTQGLAAATEGPVFPITHVCDTPLSCAILPYASETTKWVKAKGFRWNFAADGTCSPLWVQLKSEPEVWIELSFNPLTAFATEEAAHLK